MKATKPILSLHVFTEQEPKGVRAHCLEFDIAVSAPTKETAMMRMERLLDVHLFHATKHKSDPVYLAPAEVQKKWFDLAPKGDAYILQLFPPLHKNPQKVIRHKFLKHRQDLQQLSFA